MSAPIRPRLRAADPGCRASGAAGGGRQIVNVTEVEFDPDAFTFEPSPGFRVEDLGGCSRTVRRRHVSLPGCRDGAAVRSLMPVGDGIKAPGRARRLRRGPSVGGRPGHGVPLFGGPAQPDNGLLMVPGHAPPTLVPESEDDLSVGVAPFGGPAVPLGGLAVIPGHTPPLRVQTSEGVLSDGVVLFSGSAEQGDDRVFVEGPPAFLSCHGSPSAILRPARAADGRRFGTPAGDVPSGLAGSPRRRGLPGDGLRYAVRCRRKKPTVRFHACAAAASL